MRLVFILVTRPFTMFKLRTNLNFTALNMPYVKTPLIYLGIDVKGSLVQHFKTCEGDVWAPKGKLA